MKYETETEINEQETEQAPPPKWRNLYFVVETQSVINGDYLWDTREQAEQAAINRPMPELNEWLGAFPEAQC